MLRWLKSGQLTQHQQLAERLGRNLSTVTRWLQRYRQRGLSGLLEVKVAPGKPSKLTPEALAGLKAQLDSPDGFKSYGEIVEWLKTTSNLQLSYPTVYEWVHYRLKAKLKVPRPRSAQKDPAAVERLKKHRTCCASDGRIVCLRQTIRYWVEDETRLGLKTKTGKVITHAGVRQLLDLWCGRACERLAIYSRVSPSQG